MVKIWWRCSKSDREMVKIWRIRGQNLEKIWSKFLGDVQNEAPLWCLMLEMIMGIQGATI